MQKPSFTKTPLATGVALALGASALTPASAQDEPIDEVVVTGVSGTQVIVKSTLD